MKIYEIIYQDLENDISSQKLKQGARLPSITSLTIKYNCSKGTVIRALDKLSSKHIIFSKPKSGYFVANAMIKSQDKFSGYYLDSGNPRIDAFPILDIKHCLHLAADLYAKNSLEIDLYGTASLNQVLVKHLASEGIFAKAVNIQLIQGITPILTFLTITPFPNNKNTILIEEPTYSYFNTFLKQKGIPVLTIARDEFGIDLKLLEHHFKYDDIKFFYTIPRNHNPLGTCYSAKTRNKIMELALKYDVYIVEDDYFGNTHKLAKYSSLHYISYGQKTIYLRSYSKEFPFIRVGIAVVPDCFLKTFDDIAQEAYYYCYHMPNLISQATLEAYIQSSIHEKQELQLHQSITKKLNIVKKISLTWNTDVVTLIGASSGYYFSLRLNKNICAKLLVKVLEEKNIFVTSNEWAYFDPKHFDNSIRLSVARITERELKEILPVVYETILLLGE